MGFRDPFRIDGGDVRGIVPLQILKLLEDRVGLPYPVQENFDGAVGISSGRSPLAGTSG